MKHKHHIIPKHMGGTDDPTNLIELTVEEHAEAHKHLYEQHGKWQDFIAWQSLLGIIASDKVHSEATKSGMKEWWKGLSEEEKQEWKDKCSKKPEGWVAPKGWNHSEETKQRMRGPRDPYGPPTLEHRENVSKNRKGKALGKRNAMANAENREKQRQACVGRKRVYRDDGTWYWGRH